MQKNNEFHSRYNIIDLFLDDYGYGDWFVSQPEGDEKGDATTRK